MRTPTWQEVVEFCRIDGWELVRSTGHTFYRKVLPDGTVLRTHTSFAAAKSMPPSQFSFILRTQLMVTQDRFWETLLTRRPVRRPPAPTPELAPAPPQWVVDALKYQFGKSEEEIAAMTPDEAEQYVREQWDKPRDG